jgi:hypothetical protein
MKKLFEIFLVTTIFFAVLYFILYFLYFNHLCNTFTREKETNLTFAIQTLAKCKDSLVCYPTDIKTNEKNEVNSWSCLKKKSPVF